MQTCGGSLPFDLYMQMSLYEENLGYYEAATVFGVGGDFVTAPNLGPWLALGFTDLIAWAVAQLPSHQSWTLLEQGGGSGQLLVDVVTNLCQRGLIPSRIISVEKSSQMRARQAVIYTQHGLDVTQYADYDAIEPIENLVLYCNELPDAFPVSCFSWRDGAFVARTVACEEDHFVWKDGDALTVAQQPVIADTIVAQWPEGYQSEWNPHIQGWQQSISRVMHNGFLFCLDYGYSQQEYYRANRIEGTLMGHYAHQVVHDVLSVPPGSCDLTAHIDFTHLLQCGLLAGLQPCHFLPQGAWLAQSPSVQAEVQRLAAQGDVESVAMIAHAKRLMLPMGMGESFKLLVQRKGMAAEKVDFLSALDRLSTLQ
ncbi:MAG: SAM-dependent methyltransferase [Zetaproteobacteria bacterium]|nr:SAM-dependent methyltransferase [Zetaproteobacteria bacterium]